MLFGFSLPTTTDGEALCDFAQAAEALNVDSVWMGDHIILPTNDSHQYPYTDDGAFPLPTDSPVMETITVLSYVASRTKTIKVGSTVVILAHRNPIVQAKMFSTLDVLTGGRVICGVGVGWLEKEFDILRVPYSERGALSDEYLGIFRCLWTEEYPVFDGRFFKIEGIRFYPKPVQKPHLPIWVGGHSRAAIRRTVKYGDTWHPTRQTPRYVEAMIPYLRRYAEKNQRDPETIGISLKRSLHFTDIGLPNPEARSTGGAVVGGTAEIIEDILECQKIGINQLTYDFRSTGTEQCIQMVEHFMNEVSPAVNTH